MFHYALIYWEEHLLYIVKDLWKHQIEDISNSTTERDTKWTVAGISQSMKWIEVVYLLCLIGQIADNCSFDIFRVKHSYDAYTLDIFHTNFKM